MIDKKYLAQRVVEWWCQTKGRVIICDKEVWDYIVSDSQFTPDGSGSKIQCGNRYSNYIKYIEPIHYERLQGFMGTDHMMFVAPRTIDPRCEEVIMGTDALVIFT